MAILNASVYIMTEIFSSSVLCCCGYLEILELRVGMRKDEAQTIYRKLYE
jgi:hypothetical protein